MSEEIKTPVKASESEQDPVNAVAASEAEPVSVANPDPLNAVAASEAQTASVAKPDPTAEQLLQAVEVPVVKVGDIVKGTIVGLHDKHADVEIGYKFTGFIPISEIANVYYEKVSDAVALNQEVECEVLNVDDEKESLRLSKKSVDRARAWDRVVELYNTQKTFDVKVVEAVKGGLVADIGVRGFIPASQVDTEFVSDLEPYKGQTLAVKVKEIDEEAKRAILSHRVVKEALKADSQAEFIATLEVGQEFTGTVQRLTDFGAFVNIGPVDGLVHVSELSWERVGKPQEVLNIGDTVKVKLIKLEPEKQKISLSLKALLPEPWSVAEQTIPVGSEIEGIVKRTASFGAFVEIYPGVEGLVHVTELSHSFVKLTEEVVKVGQKVKVKVLAIDAANQKASLSIKQLIEKPVDAQAELEADREQIEANSNKQNLTQNLGDLLREKLGKISE